MCEGSLSFKRGTPCRKLLELFVGAVIVSLVFVELCDEIHLIIRKLKVEDIEIILYVIYVFAAGYHDKAHLSVPAQDDLSGGLAVFIAELGKDRLLH